MVKLFHVSETQNWRETDLKYFVDCQTHREVASKLPLHSVRVNADRYNEIEKTGHYYRITLQKKGGQAHIYEIISESCFS